MDLAPFVCTFGIIAASELGDKTQIAAITLSTRYRASLVFVGAMLAMVLVDGVSILAGVAIGNLIPMRLVGLFGAIIFIGFGIYSLLSKEPEKVKARKGKFAILASFSMVALMELGDKTQLAVIALSANYGAPLQVFLGMVLAYVLLMGVGVLVGSRLLKLVPQRYLRIFSGAVFLIFGAIFLLSVVGVSFG